MKFNRWVFVAAVAALLALALPRVAAAGGPPSATPPSAPAGPGAGGIGPAMQGRPIDRVQFRGNRKVEDDAIRVNLLTKAGGLLDLAKLREDIRSMWRMGFFADISVEGDLTATGSIALTFAVKEKPSIRHVFVSGNDEVELDKINEAIDLELDSIVDVSKIKKDRDKIIGVYIEKGFYLATVDYEIKSVSETEVDVYFIVDEKSKVKIREVQFIGNKNISDDELRGVIQTQRENALSFINDSGTYNEENFSRDLSLLTAHYWDQGYAAVKIGTPQLRLSRDKQYMYLSIPIDEGPVFTVSKVEFKGDLIGDAAQQQRMLGIRPGMKFSRTIIAADRETLSNYYMDQGYAYASVLPMTRMDMAKHEVVLSFEIARGKKAYFERINIHGNSKTRDKVIRREMKIAEGELFNNTNLEISKNRITALGYFEKVDVSTSRGSSDEFVEVNVEVSERATGTFQVGAGFSSVENFIAQAQVSQNNLFGRGQTLAVQAQLSSLRQLALVRFVEPYFLDTHWTFAFDIYRQSSGYTTFSRNATGGTLTWGYPLSYEARIFATYKLEEVNISTGTLGFASVGATATPIDTNAVANLFRGGLTSSVRASIQWDTRNNRLFPSKGWYESLFFEYASQYTGSENIFTRVGGFVRHYHELWGPFVLHVNGEVGVTTSTDPLGVPISERYFLGGIMNIRGYALRSLGPILRTAQPGDPNQGLGALTLGGNLQVIFNSEIEFPLFKKVGISGVVFYDMGNAYNLEDRYCSGASQKGNGGISPKIDPCFSAATSLTTGLRKSVGFGVRWFSPIGPLRFEWGIPLDRLQGENAIDFEFTIGSFF